MYDKIIRVFLKSEMICLKLLEGGKKSQIKDVLCHCYCSFCTLCQPNCTHLYVSKATF